MISVLLILKEEFKNMYPRWVSPFIHIGIIFINLAFYWYFSKAIESKPEYAQTIGENYFWFLIIGELSLSIPIKFLSKPSLILKQLYLKNLLDEFLMLENRLLLYVTQVSICQIFLEMSKFIIFIILLYFSGAASSIYMFFSLVLLQLFYVPLFIFLGFLACYLVIYFGRGEKAVQLIVSLLFILAGAYFPIGVLPSYLSKVLMFSPLNRLVSDTRSLFHGASLSELISVYHSTVLLSGLVLTILSYISFKYLLTKADRPLSHKPYINNI